MNEMETFFTSIQEPFPDLEDGKIHTEKFLNASNGVLNLVDRLGSLFALVKMDIENNIKKLKSKHLENPDDYKYLEDMILFEIMEGSGIAMDALLWLARGFSFLHEFFKNVIKNKESKKVEKISQLMKMSYKVTLRQHHNFIVQRSFEFACNLAPTKDHLMDVVSLGKKNIEDIVVRDMTIFLINLNVCLQKIAKFYSDQNLQNPL